MFLPVLWDGTASCTPVVSSRIEISPKESECGASEASLDDRGFLSWVSSLKSRYSTRLVGPKN